MNKLESLERSDRFFFLNALFYVNFKIWNKILVWNVFFERNIGCKYFFEQKSWKSIFFRTKFWVANIISNEILSDNNFSNFHRSIYCIVSYSWDLVHNLILIVREEAVMSSNTNGNGNVLITPPGKDFELHQNWYYPTFPAARFSSPFTPPTQHPSPFTNVYTHPPQPSNLTDPTEPSTSNQNAQDNNETLSTIDTIGPMLGNETEQQPSNN